MSRQVEVTSLWREGGRTRVADHPVVQHRDAVTRSALRSADRRGTQPRPHPRTLKGFGFWGCRPNIMWCLGTGNFRVEQVPLTILSGFTRSAACLRRPPTIFDRHGRKPKGENYFTTIAA